MILSLRAQSLRSPNTVLCGTRAVFAFEVGVELIPTLGMQSSAVEVS